MACNKLAAASTKHRPEHFYPLFQKKNLLATFQVEVKFQPNILHVSILYTIFLECHS
jgi:hypothetical protein